MTLCVRSLRWQSRPFAANVTMPTELHRARHAALHGLVRHPHGGADRVTRRVIMIAEQNPRPFNPACRLRPRTICRAARSCSVIEISTTRRGAAMMPDQCAHKRPTYNILDVSGYPA
jgi:hypothetical protein